MTTPVNNAAAQVEEVQVDDAQVDQVSFVPWYAGHLAFERKGPVGSGDRDPASLRVGRGSRHVAAPAVLLIHGMAGSRETWRKTQAMLAKTCDVIAVDLPGHGQSSLPNGDYSLGSLAAALRDLLDRLDVDRATIVGHSLGGGIALQFVYQFPERCERLVLVSSGGLGREVSPFLRALSLPGASTALSGLLALRRSERVQGIGRFFQPVARRVYSDLPLMLTYFAALQEPALRRSFIATIRAVIDPRGQSVTAMDRLPLARRLPVMVVWGRRDQMIPPAHALGVAQALPHARIEVFDEAGHYPHENDPERFAKVLATFVAETPPAHLTSRDLLDEAAAEQKP